MTRTIAVERKDVSALVAVTFPEYAGRSFSVQISERVTFFNINWCGGTRYQYRSCSLTGQPLGSMDKYSKVPPWENPAEGKAIDIPRGACVVRHGIVAGKDAGITVFMRPDDVPPALQAPAEQCMPYEALVLVYTQSRKSHYNGQDRYEMARGDTKWGVGEAGKVGINETNFPTREQWEAAKAALIARGLLDKRGAITRTGRNVASGLRGR